MPNWRRKKTKKAKVKKAQDEGLSPAQMKDLEPITQEGAKMWARMNKNDAMDAIHFGEILRKEKKIIVGKDEGKKGVWGRYRTKHYPGLEAKTAQRYMQLAEHVDLEEHPTLAYLGQAKLLRLIQLGDEKTPAETLGAEGVDIEFDVKDVEARKQFQSETTGLIKKLVAKSRKDEREKEESSSKEPGKEAAKMIKKWYELLKKQPGELEGLEELLDGDRDLRKNFTSIMIRLRKLLKEILKPAGKPSATKKAKPKKVAAKGKGGPKKTSVKRNRKSKRASGRERE